MTLPTDPEEGRPTCLSEDWEWEEDSAAWEQTIGDKRLVYSLGYMVSYEESDDNYLMDFHTFLYDSVREALADANHDQVAIDEFFGMTSGALEGGYDLAEDLAGVRGDVMGDAFKCECGHEEFYVIATKSNFGGYARVYGCTAAGCSVKYGDEEIPSGVSVNVANIHYMD